MEIDLVIPMVFPEDPQWRAQWRQDIACGEAAEQMVRWRSWGTEEVLVKAARKYMPWLRNIIILLAQSSQKRGWMQPLINDRRTDAPQVRVVLHKEFIPLEYRPAYNSCTIELFLHNIPGLSDHFIYANDDMFPLSPLQETDFFRNGLPCMHLDRHEWPADPTIYTQTLLHEYEAAMRVCGREMSKDYYLRTIHTMSPFLKEVFEAAWQAEPDKLAASITRTRATCNFSQSHFLYLQYLSEHYVEHEFPRRYCSAMTPVYELEQIIANPQCGVVCINDNENSPDWQAWAIATETAMRAKVGI